MILHEEDRRAEARACLSGVIDDLVDLRLQSQIKSSEKGELNTRVTRILSSDLVE